MTTYRYSDPTIPLCSIQLSTAVNDVCHTPCHAVYNCLGLWARNATTGTRKLKKISETVEEKGHTYKGFNFFSYDDLEVLRVIMSGEFNVSGFQNKNLRSKINDKTSAQVSRLLKRLRVHGMIKKIGKTYKYYVTSFGKEAICLGLKLRELYIIPQLQMQT